MTHDPFVAGFIFGVGLSLVCWMIFRNFEPEEQAAGMSVSEVDPVTEYLQEPDLGEGGWALVEAKMGGSGITLSAIEQFADERMARLVMSDRQSEAVPFTDYYVTTNDAALVKKLKKQGV